MGAVLNVLRVHYLHPVSTNLVGRY
jgi:hypothetical protein